MNPNRPTRSAAEGMPGAETTSGTPRRSRRALRQLKTVAIKIPPTAPPAAARRKPGRLRARAAMLIVRGTDAQWRALRLCGESCVGGQTWGTGVWSVVKRAGRPAPCGVRPLRDRHGLGETAPHIPYRAPAKGRATLTSLSAADWPVARRTRCPGAMPNQAPRHAPSAANPRTGTILPDDTQRFPAAGRGA